MLYKRIRMLFITHIYSIRHDCFKKNLLVSSRYVCDTSDIFPLYVQYLWCRREFGRKRTELIWVLRYRRDRTEKFCIDFRQISSSNCWFLMLIETKFTLKSSPFSDRKSPTSISLVMWNCHLPCFRRRSRFWNFFLIKARVVFETHFNSIVIDSLKLQRSANRY